jgi:rhodanese-related sulfurtransferase
MRRILATLTAFAFLASFAAFAQGPAPTPGSEAFAKVIAEASQAGWLQVQPEAALQQIDAIQPFLLDVRNQSEWDQNGHIQGAVLVPVTELANNLAKLPSNLDDPILVYCAAGTRGFYGTLYLKMLGYSNVKNIAGGLGAWSSAGLPIAH